MRNVFFVGVVFAIATLTASEAGAVCTMPAGTIEVYAGPGSHNMSNGDICDYNAAKKTWDHCSLSGWLYQPTGISTKRPVILYIQGSGSPKNQSQFCSMIDYFVAQKFIVWVPYLRGYADKTSATVKDTTNNVIINNPNSTKGFANSGKLISGTDSIATMIDEVDHEIQWSITHLTTKHKDIADDKAIVLAGHSFGGATVTLAADRSLQPQPAAIVDMSGAVLSWYVKKGTGYAENNAWHDALCSATKNRKMPMLFFQVMNETPIWDQSSFTLIDKVASTQQIYDCALSGFNGIGAEMMLYSPIGNLDSNGPWCSPQDAPDHWNHCAHTTFVMDPLQVNRWDTQVKDYLAHEGIKP